MIDEQIKVDKDGTWNFQVPQNLEPGTYKITLKGKDVNGNPIEKPYTFTVQANASVQQPLPNTGLSSNLFFILAFILITISAALLTHLKKQIKFEDRFLD
jgi:LPXTG-motif cell wall-anchored protein